MLEGGHGLGAAGNLERYAEIQAVGILAHLGPHGQPGRPGLFGLQGEEHFAALVGGQIELLLGLVAESDALDVHGQND